VTRKPGGGAVRQHTRNIGAERIDTWWPTSSPQRLMEDGGRRVKHAQYDRDWLMLADGLLTRRLFGAIVQRPTTLLVQCQTGTPR